MPTSTDTSELIAVFSASQAEIAAESLRAAGAAEATVSVAAGLGAALAKPSPSGFWTSRKTAGKALVARQKQLEALHAAMPILPAAPGAALRGADAPAQFLTANADLLAQGLARLGDCEQHQIVVALPTEPAMAAIRDRDDWPEIEATLRAADSKAEKFKAARKLATAADAVRSALHHRARAILSDLADDVALLPQGDESVAINAAVLTPRGAGASIEAALEALDAEWRGQLKIRLIGPAPASSFGAVLLETLDPAAVTRAATLLDVDAAAAPETVRAAYRAAMKQVHPDVSKADTTELSSRISAAGALLKRVASARAALRRADASALPGVPTLATLRREGDAAPV